MIGALTYRLWRSQRQIYPRVSIRMRYCRKTIFSIGTITWLSPL